MILSKKPVGRCDELKQQVLDCILLNGPGAVAYNVAVDGDIYLPIILKSFP